MATKQEEIREGLENELSLFPPLNSLGSRILPLTVGEMERFNLRSELHSEMLKAGYVPVEPLIKEIIPSES